MASCLEPDCPNAAVSGSDFCGMHTLRGKPVIYVKGGPLVPAPHVGLSDPTSDGDPDFELDDDIEIEDDDE